MANIAGVPLEAVKTATQNVFDTLGMLSMLPMRPKVFLSSVRNDAVLPPLGSPSNSSQSVRHPEPKGLNVWMNVGRKERVSALLRRLAHVLTRRNGSDDAAGSSTAAGGSSVTGGSTAAGGGGGGSSTPGGCRSAEGSGRSGSAKGGGGGGSSFEAEVLTLIEDADDIFRSEHEWRSHSVSERITTSRTRCSPAAVCRSDVCARVSQQHVPD